MRLGNKNMKETGIRPDPTATMTPVKQNFLDRAQNSNLLQTLSQSANQIRPIINEPINFDQNFRNPLPDEQSWFLQETLIKPLPNFTVLAGLLVTVAGAWWILDSPEENQKTKRR